MLDFLKSLQPPCLSNWIQPLYFSAWRAHQRRQVALCHIYGQARGTGYSAEPALLLVVRTIPSNSPLRVFTTLALTQMPVQSSFFRTNFSKLPLLTSPLCVCFITAGPITKLFDR